MVSCTGSLIEYRLAQKRNELHTKEASNFFLYPIGRRATYNSNLRRPLPPIFLPAEEAAIGIYTNRNRNANDPLSPLIGVKRKRKESMKERNSCIYIKKSYHI